MEVKFTPRSLCPRREQRDPKNTRLNGPKSQSERFPLPGFEAWIVQPNPYDSIPKATSRILNIDPHLSSYFRIGVHACRVTRVSDFARGDSQRNNLRDE